MAKIIEPDTRKIKPIELVKRTDSSLTLEDVFLDSTSKVYLITRNGMQYILKGVDLDSEECITTNQFYDELKALSQADSVEGISHLIKDYGPNGYHFMLKEFAPGTDWRSLKEDEDKPYDIKTSPHSEKFYQKMERCFKGLHESGSVGLDQDMINFIISPNLDDITFIDFSSALHFWFRNEINSDIYERLCKLDMMKLHNKFHDKDQRIKIPMELRENLPIRDYDKRLS